jgi:hypothetical protein
MKRIVLNLPVDAAQKPSEVIKEIVSFSPNKAISVEEMRQRVAVMEALDRATDEVLLEDATWQILADAIRTFPFNRASRDLLTVVDAVLNAETVDVTELGAKRKKTDG